MATVTVDPVNDLPLITNGPDTTATENVDYTLDLDGDDVDGDVLTWSLPVAPTGMVINAVTGEISWLPGQADVGSEAVTAKVVDPSGGADSLSWTLTVLPANSPPVVSALADTSFDEDATLILNMNAVVTDPDNPDAGITWSVSGNTDITVNIADSLITLGTTADYNGSEQLTFTATDAGGLSDSKSATITVNPMNDKPTITSAPDTTATEGVDYTLDVDALDVDGDVLTWSLPVAPGGMVVNALTGEISWLPTQTNVGDTTVVAKVVDPTGGADSLSFTLTVLPANSAPIVSAIADTSFDEDATLILNMNAVVTDPDNPDAGITWSVSGNTDITVNIADSLITLGTTADYNGSEQLTFTATDAGGLSDSKSATITVNPMNDKPTITSAPDTTATEGVDYTLDVDALDVDGDVLTWSLPVAPGGMVVNALTGEISWLPTQTNVGDTTVVAKVVDPTGGADSLSFTLTVLPANSAPIVSAIADTSFDEDGALVLNMNVLVNDPDNIDSEITWSVSGNANITVTIADSLVTLSTVADFNGVEQLTFTATDPGGLSDSESATVTVNPVNDIPTITNGPDTTATENVDYTLDLNALDVDGDVLTWSLPVAPGGMVVNALTGEISWLPTQANVGDTTVTAKVVDGSGAADSLSWTLTVLNANTAPTIAIGSQGFVEDDSLIINMNPLIDDVDNSDAELTVEVSGNSDIKVSIVDSLVTLTAAKDFNGVEQLTFTVRDAGGLSASTAVTVTVSPAADAPVMVSVPDSVATEDVDYTFDVDATDADGDVLTYSLLIAPGGMVINAGTGVIQWTPQQAHVGDTTVSVEVTDGALKDTLTYTLTVQNAGDAPVAVIPDTSFAEDSSLVLNLNDFVTDVDTPKDQLTWGLSNNTKIVAVINDSIVSLSAPADYNGAEQLQFLVVDSDGLSDIEQFTVTVLPVADVPVIRSSPDTTATEDDDYTFDVDATDADGDVLAYTLLIGPTGMVIDAATGVIQWLPLQEHVDTGDNAVSVRVADPGGLADTLSFVIRVQTDNDVPVISGIPDTSFVEDGSLTLNLNNYVSDVDDDNADLEWSVAGNSLIVVTVNDSIASLSAPENYNGSEQISFHATDTKGASTSDILVVTVTPVNDVPVITSDPATEATEDAVYTYDVESTDVENDSRTYALTQNPDGMVVDPATGLISWHVPLHVIGDFPVTVTVTETSTSPPLSDTQAYTVSVRNVNDPPTITFSDTSFAQNDTLTVSFSALNLNDRDPDDSFDALRRTLRINGLSVYSRDLTLGKPTGEHAIGVETVDVQGNIYFAIDTTVNEIRFWHRAKWFGEEKMSFETTDNSGYKVNDEVSIRVTPLPILSIFPVADTIKTNAAEFTLEGIASQVDSLWITYLRDDGVLLELPLILIVNNQFSQLIPINNGVDPRTIRITLRAKNSYANSSTYLREVTFRPTVDDEEGGVILLNDDDGIPNNNTRVEVGDQSVPEDVDLVLAPDDSAAQAILGADAGRLVNAYEIDAFDQNGVEIDNFKFLRKVTLVLRYDDAGLTLEQELNLKAYFYDGAEFRLIGGRVDTTNNTVTVEIDHLTQFAVLHQQAGDDKGFVYAAPNPFTPVNAGNQFDETQFIIPPADLGVSFTIEIYNARGQLVRRLENLTKWDGKDDQGRIMDSGVYIFQFVTDTKRTSGTVLLVR